MATQSPEEVEEKPYGNKPKKMVKISSPTTRSNEVLAREEIMQTSRVKHKNKNSSQSSNSKNS